MSRRRTTICREGWYYLLITAVVFGGAMFKEVNLLLILAGMLLGSALLNWRAVQANLRGLRVDRTLPPELSAGDQLSVDLRLTNTRRRLGSWAVVVEEETHRRRRQRRSHGSPPIASPRDRFPTCPPANRARAATAGGCRSAAATASVRCGFRRGFPSGCFRGRCPWSKRDARRAAPAGPADRRLGGAAARGLRRHRSPARPARHRGRFLRRARVAQRRRPAVDPLAQLRPAAASWWCGSSSGPATATWPWCSISGSRAARRRARRTTWSWPSVLPPRCLTDMCRKGGGSVYLGAAATAARSASAGRPRRPCCKA